jgi:hypothetical protein
MKKSLLIDFSIRLSRNMQSGSEHRYGQMLFNALWDVDPILANEINGTDADPYYAESNSPTIDLFWAKLGEDDNG